MAQTGFWDKPSEAQATISELKSLKKLIEPWRKVFTEIQELEELLNLVDDENLLAELESNGKRIEHEIHNL